MKPANSSRRHFLATTLAAGAVAGTPAFAHNTTPYALPDEYLPVVVTLAAGFGPGEIHVDPNNFKLYWTLTDGKAIRYTVGIGRPGLYHPGEFTVGRKAKWPSWTPTPAMIRRDSSYARWKNGMPGGPNNPLGARALYLFNAAGHDTYLRIHGTNLPRTIGTAVSNGCARLLNDHVVDLYERVPAGTQVKLYEKGQMIT